MTTLKGVSFRVIPKYVAAPKEVSCRQISNAFVSGVVDPDSFIRYLNASQKSATTLDQLPNGDVEPSHLAIVENLQAVATVASVYAHKPNATVALSMIRYGALTKAHWFKRKRQPTFQAGNDNRKTNMLLAYTLSRSATFACVSMFESGGLTYSQMISAGSWPCQQVILSSLPRLCFAIQQFIPSLPNYAGLLGLLGEQASHSWFLRSARARKSWT